MKRLGKHYGIAPQDLWHEIYEQIDPWFGGFEQLYRKWNRQELTDETKEGHP